MHKHIFDLATQNAITPADFEIISDPFDSNERSKTKEHEIRMLTKETTQNLLKIKENKT